MTSLDNWQNQLPSAYAEFARLAATSPETEAGPGLTGAAILWPIRQAIQEFEGEALDAVRDICGAEAKYIFKAVQGWGNDPLTAARDLTAQTQTNPSLTEALNKLNQHFQVASLLAEALAQALVEKQGRGDIYHIAGQIKAALVNIGGTITIESLTLNIGPVPSFLQVPVPPPSEPAHPPTSPHFVGREVELASFLDQLTRVHVAAITGMAGVGKTALAATLAQRQQLAKPDKVLWHAFHEEDDVYRLIWQLAGFLAWHGQAEPWELLQRTQQTGGRMQPPGVLFDYLFQLMRGQGYLLCLDDFQVIDDDPHLNALAERLGPAIMSGELTVIITSRRLPNFIQLTQLNSLTGLSTADTCDLLKQRGLALPAEVVAELHTRTEGNPQLLSLAIKLLKRAEQPAEVVNQLARAENITRYLVQEVDKALTEPDREIMVAVAILLGYPGTRDAIEAVTNRSRLKPLLLRLSREHLLVTEASPSEPEYNEHTLVREFYYDLPGQRERRELHQRAAQYYESEAPDWLRAARHYHQAGDHKQAARLATLDIWSLINQGQDRALRRLLEQFTPSQLGPELWVQVKLALGELYTWLCESELAQASFQAALTRLAELPDSTSLRTLQARACLGLGSLLRYHSPAEGLPWLQQGLTALDPVNWEQAAALHIEIGLSQINLGEFNAAGEALNQGLRLLAGVEAPRLRVTALLNLGNVYAAQGDLRAANRYNREALQISQSIGDYFRMITIWQNLGIDDETAGQWDSAKAKYRQALALAQKLGGVERLVGLNLSLGVLATKQGEDETALIHLPRCLALARQHHLEVYIAWAASSLADLHLRRGELTQAAPLLAEAEHLAQEHTAGEVLPEIYRELAQLHLAQADLPAALNYARQSITQARDQGMKLEEGMAQRVLGQILVASGQIEAALAAFQSSLTLLTESDPNEAARTQASWGLVLAAGPDPEQGRRLLLTAQATFQELGAQRDLAVVEAALDQ